MMAQGVAVAFKVYFGALQVYFIEGARFCTARSAFCLGQFGCYDLVKHAILGPRTASSSFPPPHPDF